MPDDKSNACCLPLKTDPLGVRTNTWTGLCRKSKARPVLDGAEGADVHAIDEVCGRFTGAGLQYCKIAACAKATTFPANHDHSNIGVVSHNAAGLQNRRSRGGKFNADGATRRRLFYCQNAASRSG